VYFALGDPLIGQSLRQRESYAALKAFCKG